mmetsp:Transcript_19133/g.26781  ORF Transcript_19133/g.26781 Transcript_19133/m.26781 type:complete len:88 (-) Transcript_19133:479-742(-)
MRRNNFDKLCIKISKDQLFIIFDSIKETKHILQGYKNIIKMMFKNKISYIVFATNCPDYLRTRILYYCTLNKVKFSKFPGSITCFCR